MIAQTKSKLKKYVEELLAIRTTPFSIAFGFALGTFIAILPTFGLGVFIGLGLLLVFRKANKLSMFLAFAIWNPIILFLLTALNYGIGEKILSGQVVSEGSVEIYNTLSLYTQRLLVGSVIMAIGVSLLCFGLIYAVTWTFRWRERIFEKLDKAILAIDNV